MYVDVKDMPQKGSFVLIFKGVGPSAFMFSMALRWQRSLNGPYIERYDHVSSQWRMITQAEIDAKVNGNDGVYVVKEEDYVS
jgi:hypothetical protein